MEVFSGVLDWLVGRGGGWAVSCIILPVIVWFVRGAVDKVDASERKIAGLVTKADLELSLAHFGTKLTNDLNQNYVDMRFYSERHLELERRMNEIGSRLDRHLEKLERQGE